MLLRYQLVIHRLRRDQVLLQLDSHHLELSRHNLLLVKSFCQTTRLSIEFSSENSQLIDDAVVDAAYLAQILETGPELVIAGVDQDGERSQARRSHVELDSHLFESLLGFRKLHLGKLNRGLQVSDLILELRLTCPTFLNSVAQLLGVRDHPVDLLTSAVDVLVRDFGDGRCGHDDDEKCSEDPGESFHGTLGGTTTSSPLKAIRPSSLSNVRWAWTERAASG